MAEIRKFKLKENHQFNNTKIIDKNPSVKVIDMETWEHERDERIMERQYQEFISLLKYFVHIQEDKHEVVYITFESENTFNITDENGVVLESEIDEGLYPNLQPEDVIISSLISLSPRKVVIVNEELLDEKTKKSILDVFGERVQFDENRDKLSPVFS